MPSRSQKTTLIPGSDASPVTPTPSQPSIQHSDGWTMNHVLGGIPATFVHWQRCGGGILVPYPLARNGLPRQANRAGVAIRSSSHRGVGAGETVVVGLVLRCRWATISDTVQAVARRRRLLLASHLSGGVRTGWGVAAKHA